MKKILLTAMIMGFIPLCLSAAMCAGCRRGHANSSASSQAQAHRTNWKHQAHRYDHTKDQYVTSQDRQILGEIKNELYNSNMDRSDSNVEIFVEYGKVVFSGEVATFQEKEQLEEIANNAEGVQIVVNKIFVDDKKPMTKTRNPRLNQ